MKYVLGTLALLVVAVVAAVVAATGGRETIALPELAITIPAATPPADMSLSALPTGHMYSRAALAYEGGAFGDERLFAMTPVLIHHPQGDLLIDAGFASNVQAHLRMTPFLMRALTKMDALVPAATQLKQANYDFTHLKGVLLTHAHWDHVSGLADLPTVPALVTQDELDFIHGCSEPARLACSYGQWPWQVYAFEGGPYLGFEKSHDVYGDGSVVVVPAAGHTPGSVIVFVTLPDQSRYAFIGDLAWQREGVEIPAQRPALPRALLHEDAAAVRALLGRLHQLQTLVPKLTVVPAHDERVFETLPRFKPG